MSFARSSAFRSHLKRLLFLEGGRTVVKATGNALALRVQHNDRVDRVQRVHRAARLPLPSDSRTANCRTRKMNKGLVVDGLVVAGSRVDVGEVLRTLGREERLVEELSSDGGAAVAAQLADLSGRLQHNAARLVECEPGLRDLLERSWEQLHTGDWKAVKPQWRAVYAACALLLGHLHSLRGNWSEAARLFDLVLLMGTPSWHGMAHAALANAPVDLQEDVPGERLQWSESPPLALAPALAKWPRLTEYAQAAWPSLSEFEERHLKAGQPCVFRGLARDWPAVKQWRNVDYLMEIMGGRTVPIELGKHYMDASFSQQLMPFGAFLRQHVLGKSDTIGYLAQTELLQQVPALLQDLVVPDYCAMGSAPTVKPAINAWLGPAGTVSPLHTDPQHNVFVQVAGSKALLLHPASENARLYAEEGLMNNTSQVDAADPDLARFPKYAEARGWLAVVEAGDAVFIPHMCWHYVTSLQPSWSLSFWFD